MPASKICVVVVSGSLERLQMAAMVASVGAVSGQEVIVFLSMNALPYFVKGNTSKAPHEGDMGKLMATKKVPEFKTLFEQAVELGDAKIFPVPWRWMCSTWSRTVLRVICRRRPD